MRQHRTFEVSFGQQVDGWPERKLPASTVRVRATDQYSALGKAVRRAYGKRAYWWPYADAGAYITGSVRRYGHNPAIVPFAKTTIRALV